jgi:CRP-like cAMP-binding protein
MAETLRIGPAEFEWLQQALRLSDYLEIDSIETLQTKLPSLELLGYADGEEIVREGELGTDVFLLYLGKAVVRRKRAWAWLGSKKLSTLGPGAIFGEVGFLAETVRSATVAASGAVKAFKFGSDDMRRVMDDNPRYAQTIAQLVKERLQKLNE